MRGLSLATWALLWTCVLLPCSSPHAQAQADMRLRWRSLATPHFRVHYHEPLGVWARSLASDVEGIYGRISGALGLGLRQRIELVIADDSDSANGFANVLPYNVIRLRVAAPEDLSPLSDYDEWGSTLLTHELTHVVHLEQASRLPRLVQAIFGRIYTPQQFLPGWFVEGLAVQQESSHTTGGRARSTMLDMYMRMDALEDRALDLDLVTFDGEPWPHGNTRYIYGGAFLDFIARRHGERVLGRFVEEYGRRIVPYGMNRAMQRASGETFVELYDAFWTELRERAHAKRREIEAGGGTELTREGLRLTRHAETTRTPRFVSAHEIVYGLHDARHVPELRVLDLRTGEARRLVRTQSVPEATRVPGQRRVIYAATDFHRTTYAFDELFTVELDGGLTERLSSGLRAREPDVSPDGALIAFVTQGAGTTQLEVAQVGDVEHTRRVVVASRRSEQVYTPRWSPDGKRIAYSSFQRGGYRDVWMVELASGLRTRVTHDRALDRGPVFSPDGSRLYFSSDRSGIANLYAYELATGELSQLTDVLGGAFQPEVAPDGRSLVYVGYGSRGFDLYRFDLEHAVRKLAPAPYDRPPARAQVGPAPLLSAPYRPLRSLYPRSWQITAEDTGQGARLVVSTEGRDAVGLHGWALRADSMLEDHDFGIDASYAYRQPRFPILLYGSLRDNERYDLFANDRRYPWAARGGYVGIGQVFSVRWPLRTLTLRFDYTTSFLQKRAELAVPLDPNYPPPREPPLGFDARAHWSATWSSTTRQPFDISPSWGRAITLAGSFADEYIGSKARDYTLSLRATQYFRFSFRESVLAFAWTAAQRTWVALGGYPAQLTPLRDALVGAILSPVDYARLRGYPARRGDTLQVLQAEYRFLLGRINHGYETLPLFARRVHGAVFVDVGDAFNGGQRHFDVRRLGVGVGGELRLDWSARYGVDYTLRVGVARGVTEGGELQWYSTLATPY